MVSTYCFWLLFLQCLLLFVVLRFRFFAVLRRSPRVLYCILFNGKYRDIPYKYPIQISTYCFRLPFLECSSSSLLCSFRRLFVCLVVLPASLLNCKYMLIKLWYRLIVSDFFFYSVLPRAAAAPFSFAAAPLPIFSRRFAPRPLEISLWR